MVYLESNTRSLKVNIFISPSLLLLSSQILTLLPWDCPFLRTLIIPLAYPDNQGNLPILRSLMYLHLQGSFCHVR